jgi:hypothetical protein
MSNAPQNPPATPRRRIPFFADIYKGAVHGDFADELGLVGYTTQAVLAFVPVIGTVCAFRDFTACRRKKDRIGMTLNGLALIPFLGLFPKTAAVLRAGADAGNAMVFAKNAHTRVTQHSIGVHDDIPSSS